MATRPAAAQSVASRSVRYRSGRKTILSRSVRPARCGGGRCPRSVERGAKMKIRKSRLDSKRKRRGCSPLGRRRATGLLTANAGAAGPTPAQNRLPEAGGCVIHFSLLDKAIGFGAPSGERRGCSAVGRRDERSGRRRPSAGSNSLCAAFALANVRARLPTNPGDESS